MTIDKGKYNEEYFARYRESIARKTRGLNAPERSIRCVEAAVNLPFAESVLVEREMSLESHRDPQAKALQHVFFAERQASKVPAW